jgi:hypothetical protein
MNRRVAEIVGLLSVVLISTFECYYGWGWSIPGAAAAVALTRPWLAADAIDSPGDRGMPEAAPPPH